MLHRVGFPRAPLPFLISLILSPTPGAAATIYQVVFEVMTNNADAGALAIEISSKAEAPNPVGAPAKIIKGPFAAFNRDIQKSNVGGTFTELTAFAGAKGVAKANQKYKLGFGLSQSVKNYDAKLKATWYNEAKSMPGNPKPLLIGAQDPLPAIMGFKAPKALEPIWAFTNDTGRTIEIRDLEFLVNVSPLDSELALPGDMPDFIPKISSVFLGPGESTADIDLPGSVQPGKFVYLQGKLFDGSEQVGAFLYGAGVEVPEPASRLFIFIGVLALCSLKLSKRFAL